MTALGDELRRITSTYQKWPGAHLTTLLRPFLLAMASPLIAMASALIAMASNLLAIASNQQPFFILSIYELCYIISFASLETIATIQGC